MIDKVKLVGKSIVSRGRNLIYIPQRYDSKPEYRQAMQEVEAIHYTSGGDKMVSWMAYDEANQKTPDRIWLLFSGNASLALNWLPVTELSTSSNDAYVMLEYPGYGKCEGKPSRQSIIDSTDQLIETICERFSIDVSEISSRFRVMGSSLGAAIALQTAARLEIHKGVVIAPFSSIRDTGALMFPKFLTYLTADPYDNMARLGEINQQKNSDTHIHIVHGEEDELLPLWMGQKLNDSFPDITTLWPIPGAGHSDVKFRQTQNLARALSNDGEFSL